MSETLTGAKFSSDQIAMFVGLGDLVMKFGLIKRLTLHEDKVTNESDTTHTVMLSYFACSFAEQHLPELSLGRISQLCSVHDIVEAIAGDTPTFNYAEYDKRAKEKRENQAFIQIKEKFANYFPWLVNRLEEYEHQETAESRYVKAMDKIMPGITHILNSGEVIRQSNMGRDEHSRNAVMLRSDISSYTKDMPVVIEFFDEIINKVVEVTYGAELKA